MWGDLAYDYLPVSTERRSHVLHPFAIPCMQGVLALNVTRGCAHACVYCYARAYPEAPPRGQLFGYEKPPPPLPPGHHGPFAPGAPPRGVGLENLRRLRAAAIAAGIRHDPVIPGVTD